MTQIIDLGKLRMDFKGVYDPATTYELNDVVSYGANAYVYKFATATAGNLPTNTTYWALMVSGIQFEGVWSSSTAYQARDVVTFGARTYISLQAHTNQNPTQTDYWEVLASGIRTLGDWSNATAYYFPGDVVTRGGTQYITSSYHVPNVNFSIDLGASKWTVFVSGLRFRGVWAANTAYLKDDLVTDGLNSYLATQDFTSNGATFSAETAGNWTLFTPGTDNLPAQAGNENYLLTTDGTDPLWTDSIDLGGSATVAGTVYTGPGAAAFETSAALTNAASVTVFNNNLSEDGFAQIAFRNADDTSSSDIIAYSADGNDVTGWVSLGVTGKDFGDPEFTLTTGNTAYVFYEAEDDAAANGGTGNLVFATGDKGTDNAIVFAAGGFASGTEQMTITPNENVHIEISTESTSPSNGAFTVVGGAGIQGNLNVAGNAAIQGNQSLVGNLVIQGSLSVAGGQFATENLSSTDPLLFVGNQNEGNEFDLGFLTEAKQPATPISFPLSSVSVSSNVVTVTSRSYTVLFKSITSNVATLSIGSHSYAAGNVVTVTGVDATFNGTYTITAVAATTISYAKTASDLSQTAATGTVQVLFNTSPTIIAGDFVTISDSGTAFDGVHHVTAISSTTFSFEQTIANQASTNLAADTIATRSSRSKYSGIVKNNTDGAWYLFSNLENRPTTTVDFTSPEIVLDKLNIGILDVSTTSTFRGDVVAQKKFNVFATAAARDAAIPAPDAGTMCYRTDIKSQEFYTGTKWEVVENAISPLLTMALL